LQLGAGSPSKNVDCLDRLAVLLEAVVTQTLGAGLLSVDEGLRAGQLTRAEAALRIDLDDGISRPEWQKIIGGS